MEELKKLSGEKGTYMLVKGVAKPAVESLFQTAVKKQLLYRQNLYSLFLPLQYSFFRAIQPKCNQDAEAQNFMLHAPNGEMVTIYPTQKTSLLGFEERTKIVIPHYNNSPVSYYITMPFAFLQSILTLGSRIDLIDANQYYHRMSTEIVAGDEIFTFGKVRFNEAHGFFIDKPIAFVFGSAYLAGALRPLRNYLSLDKLKHGFLAGFALTAMAGCLFTACYFGQRAIMSLMPRLEQRHQELLNMMDSRPEIVKELPEDLRSKQIVVDSFCCTTCDKSEQPEGSEVNCREIVHIPCMHCYQCSKCWEKEEDKKVCKTCGKRVDKVMRIFFARQEVEV